MDGQSMQLCAEDGLIQIMISKIKFTFLISSSRISSESALRSIWFYGNVDIICRYVSGWCSHLQLRNASQSLYLCALLGSDEWFDVTLVWLVIIISHSLSFFVAESYQPSMVVLNRSNRSWLRGFVSMSANWSWVLIGWMVISPWSTYPRKCWSFTLMCFVRGRTLCTFAISNAPLLSSKTLQCTLGLWSLIGNPCCCISFMSSIIGIASRSAYDRPIYSLSVDDSAISVCSWDFHMIGHPAYIITYPCLERAVSGSFPAMSMSQFPAKSASTNTSNDRSNCGRRWIPLSFVPLRYLAIQRTAFPCSVFGSEQNRAHWGTAY